jgi:glycosyltransferase involved in cell wall biosynthesis
MVGRHPGRVITQSLVLSDLFKDSSYSVIAVSDLLNRYLRLADIAGTLITQHNKYDIILLDVFGGPSFVIEDIASRIGRQFGKKVVMFLRGGAMPEFMARYPRWTRRVLSRADVILAPSPFLARAITPYGFQAQVIPNVIDLSAYPYRHRQELKPRLFWMRSFHPIWNPAMAVRVLARVKATIPDATLVMAGEDKGIVQEVRQLAKNLGVAGSVRFAGFLDMAGKKREGDLAEIYLNTNRVDNMPVSVVEAGAMGIPVVTTNVGGIPDLLDHGENALFVSDEDDEAMAQAILSLLNDPDLAGRLSAGGRRLAERSSWEQILPQWEQVFIDIMARPDKGLEVSDVRHLWRRL